MQQPAAVEQILRKLLAIRVPERYKTCSDLLRDWDEYCRLNREADERRAQMPQIAPTAPTRLPVWIYVAAGAGFVAVLFIVLLLAGVFSK